jgi:hypothetical protein
MSFVIGNWLGQICQVAVEIARKIHRAWVAPTSRQICTEPRPTCQIPAKCSPLRTFPSFRDDDDAPRHLRKVDVHEETTRKLATHVLQTHTPRSQNVVTFKQKVRIAMQIAEGMSYLHDLNVIHRDLNTRNCLLSGNMQVSPSLFSLSTLSLSTLYSLSIYLLYSTLSLLSLSPPLSLSHAHSLTHKLFCLCLSFNRVPEPCVPSCPRAWFAVRPALHRFWLCLSEA